MKMDFHEYFRKHYTDKSYVDLPDLTKPASAKSSVVTMDNATEPEIEAHNLHGDSLSAAEAATERVATLIGDDFECNGLFCQMDMLRPYKNDLVWKEMARWIRYEEAVEEGGQRWSKPHVASLMMEALQDLQCMLGTCPVLLDITAGTMREIACDVSRAWTADGDIPRIWREQFEAILTKPHMFQHNEKKKKHQNSLNLHKMIITPGDGHVNKGYDGNESNNSLQLPGETICPDSPSLALGEMNKSFLRKIPPGSEVANLLVGENNQLDKIIAAFVRLKRAGNVGDITEVNLATKFLFVVLGPRSHLGHCAEMCRCMAALLTDEFFRIVAYRGTNRQDLLAGMQEFSLHLTVLPPGVWNPNTRIEPPDEKPSQVYRKTGNLNSSKHKNAIVDLDKLKDGDHEDEVEGHSDPTLVRTGKLFGGLRNDIRRKLPFMLSDFKDAFHIQCIASFFFLFLASLTPNVTFGGLLTTTTDNYMGTIECILSAAISGVLFALFSGQPLNILASTGPMLILEGILYRFCVDHDWDFMPFRVWVGFWTGFFILLIVAFDLSALVRYITRFTEESFAALVALIFIYEAFKKSFEIEHTSPLHLHPLKNPAACLCILENSTGGNATLNLTTLAAPSVSGLLETNVTSLPITGTTQTLSYLAQICTDLGGYISGVGCSDRHVPDVFVFSLLLFFGTFILATVLVNFRHSLFFPTLVRTNVSDFSVIISIIVMVGIDAALGIPTPKLTVPTEFKPTKPGRPWLINPISPKNPWWLYLLSALPALLATILIFMDQQITAVIVNRRENKLKKGSGYHLDMLIVGVLVVILGLLGLPWYVAATVTALAHIMSLKKVSECTAPGEKPVFLGVREQRLTALMVAIFSGLAVLFTSVLNYIPMPVLYGVFLYMGVAPLSGMQLIQRVLIIFMPAKYQPDYSFVRNVPIRRVHLFTLIQVLFLCFVRKGLDKLFTQRELKWLDDILPATEVKKEEAEVVKEQESEPPKVMIT
ncbi:hypothetical protein DPMN_182459, partial [Dreissena polymorpha]